MKKQILSVILTLVLCISLLPAVSAPAAAAETTYDIWVGGVQMGGAPDENGNITVTGDTITAGTVTLTPASAAEDDPDTSVIENAPTLTLSGASITAAETPVDVNYNPLRGIYSKSALNLVLTGENAITAGTTEDSVGVMADARNLAISGGGSLEIYTCGYGIQANSLVTDDVTVEIIGSVYAISLNTGCIITDSTVSAVGSTWGISTTKGLIKIDNSSVYAKGGQHSFYGLMDGVSVSLSGAAHVKAEGAIDTDLRVNSDGNGYLRNAADGTLALQPSGSLEYSGDYFEYVGEGHKGSSAELVDKDTHSYPCDCAGMQVTVVTEKHNYQYAPPQDGMRNYFEEFCACGHSATANVNVPTLPTYYDGNPKEVTVTFSGDWTGEKNVSVEYFDANSGKPLDDPTDAGAYRFSVSVNGATYDGVGLTFTIGKAHATDEMKAASGETKYDSYGFVELYDLLPEGWVAGNITTTDADGVLRDDYPPGLDEHGLLTFSFVNDVSKVGKTATITVPVTSTNYNPYDIVVTVKALEKWHQTLYFDESTVTKTYGDEPFTIIAYPTAGGGDKTYKSSNPDVADIDPATGKVTIKKADAMPVTITVTAAATEDYFEATASYSLKVKQKPLTVQPKAVTVKVNAAVPIFELEYVGLVPGESLTPSPAPEFKLYKSDGTTEITTGEAVKTVGTYIIKWTNVNNIMFTGEYANNYDFMTSTIKDTAELKVEKSGGGGSSGGSSGGTTTPVTDPETGTDPETTDPVDVPFADVRSGAWYYDAVSYVTQKGFMNGTSDTAFSPNLPTSRAMIVTILWRMEGEPVVNYVMQFEDVKPDTWYTEAVRWAASEGIVTGYSDTAFGPNDLITREQLATILYRYEQDKGGGFTGAWMFRLDYDDIDEISEWAYEPMCYMTMHGIITGESERILNPQGQATRAQAATMLMRFDEYVEK